MSAPIFVDMTRWTDAKLGKELSFARAFADSDPLAVEWLRLCEAELARREAKGQK